MKTLILIASLCLAHSATCLAQSITYHLPEKKLRVTVTYKLTGYVLTSADGKVIDSRYEMVIADPVKVEEVVVPDRNRRFEVRLPERLASGGARFDWKVQLGRNGILTGWNASREPVTAQILSGAAGLVANILTGLTPVDGLLPAAEEKAYKATTEQKFTVTETIDIPVVGLDRVTVTAPHLDVPLVSIPSTTITLTPVDEGETMTGDAPRRTDVLYHIEPRNYRLFVDVNNNGPVSSFRAIDEIIRVPQHGALRQIELATLFKGRKAAALSLDPATGQLLSWEYKRSGNTRTETADLSKQLAALAEAVSAARAASDRRLEQEVSRLSLEIERLELQQRLREMEE
ncbi:MAG: hypothetical protein LOY03_17505 [Cyclobacteriaceae bacterium]|jgi:hypothetical protein|nr:hypothetical protein [Cyclobacteriaceae bacterium]